MKSIAYLIFCLILSFETAYSNERIIYLNPGVKLGYMFGKGGGFTWGLEVSLTSVDADIIKNDIYGILMDIDFRNNLTKIHLGGEYVTFIHNTITNIGISFGPTYIVNRGVQDLGLTCTAFTGAFAYPYYGFTLSASGNTYHEAGCFIKLPLPLNYHCTGACGFL